MKVFYIIYEDFSHPRASNWQIANTANGLLQSGLDIQLIFPYKFFSKEDYKLQTKSHFLFTKQFARFNIFNIIRFSWKLWKFFKTNTSSQDIIYFRHLILLPTIYFIKLFFPKLKIIYEVHREVNSYLGVFFERKLITKGIKIITISQSLQNIYLQKYKKLNSQQTIVVHDAVDYDKFNLAISSQEAQEQLSIKSTKPIVMYIGSLWSVKGVGTLLQAAKKLTDYDFYFIGKEHQDFFETKKNYTNLDNIYFPGVVDQKLVPIWQKAADLLVIPHLDNNLSQSPMKLFEYLASGIPILASNLANLREILPNDNLYFQPGNDQDLAEKIAEYFTKQEHYQKLAVGNKEIAKQYSWEQRSQRIKNFILK